MKKQNQYEKHHQTHTPSSHQWFCEPETLHIILAVTDNGVPALTRYQRVIVTVFPK
ncbi:hypothetical protein [Haliscomenobacter sp.]|uniref:hypothetical protein n=1 Tax=Haliscomenobacter sp. TaxID=2717303 RepID=UPI0035941478